MIWAVVTLAAAAVAGWAAVAVITGKRASDQVARADAERDRAAAVQAREQLQTDVGDYRRQATAAVDTMRADLERLRDELDACTDPATRRQRWSRMLAQAADVSDVLKRDPATRGDHVLPGVDPPQPAAHTAGRLADRLHD